MGTHYSFTVLFMALKNKKSLVDLGNKREKYLFFVAFHDEVACFDPI